MIRELSKMTWLDVQEADRSKTSFLLPIGSVEQHGPHLPLATDDLILTKVMQGVIEADDARRADVEPSAVKKEADVLCLPPMLFGNSHEHYSFPGTISLSCSTLVRLVEDILASIHEHGFKKLIIFNSHGGNTDLIKAYAQEWEQRFQIKVYLISLWSDLYSDDKETPVFASDASVDFHAGERETALLMHYNSGLVKEELISSEINRDIDFKSYYTGWQTGEISQGNGTLGYPTYATKEKGEVYAQFLIERTSELINEIANV